MKFIDLFAGIGGFHYAVKRVSPRAKCVFASENNKATAKTYEINHGLNPLNDITKIDISSLPKADLVCGGFSCQPFSKNGKWHNFGKIVGDDDRANLFLYVIEYLRQHRPPMVLLENVDGLTEVKNKDDVFYSDLIREAIEDVGYSVFTNILDTADYGLPQQRKRIYFVCFAHPKAWSSALAFDWPKRVERTSCINDILDDDVDPKYWLENRWAGRNYSLLTGSRLDQLYRSFQERGENVSSITKKITPIAIIYGDTPSGAPRQQDKLYSRWGISPTIATFGVSIPNIDAEPWRALTPRECARLQGFPESLILPDKDLLAYKQVGNAVSVPIVEKIIRNML
jgi:DNA (cytosine-5)-methyltransferase 1